MRRLETFVGGASRLPTAEFLNDVQDAIVWITWLQLTTIAGLGAVLLLEVLR